MASILWSLEETNELISVIEKNPTSLEAGLAAASVALSASKTLKVRSMLRYFVFSHFPPVSPRASFSFRGAAFSVFSVLCLARLRFRTIMRRRCMKLDCLRIFGSGLRVVAPLSSLGCSAALQHCRAQYTIVARHSFINEAQSQSFRLWLTSRHKPGRGRHFLPIGPPNRHSHETAIKGEITH